MLCLLVLGLLLTGCANLMVNKEKDVATAQVLKDQWGIQLQGLRLSASGYMLDLRYRVLDSEKAASLFDQRAVPYLMYEATGAKLAVPAPTKVGSLRAAANGKPIPERTYFILFANPGQFLKPGSQVTLVIGAFKVSHVTVQ